MEICPTCKRPMIKNIKDFEELVSKPYLIALADKEFMEKLRREAENDGQSL